jgi:hypothetical protein
MEILRRFSRFASYAPQNDMLHIDYQSQGACRIASGLTNLSLKKGGMYQNG